MQSTSLGINLCLFSFSCYMGSLCDAHLLEYLLLAWQVKVDWFFRVSLAHACWCLDGWKNSCTREDLCFMFVHSLLNVGKSICIFGWMVLCQCIVLGKLGFLINNLSTCMVKKRPLEGVFLVIGPWISTFALLRPLPWTLEVVVGIPN